jgi:hypothetical protein
MREKTCPRENTNAVTGECKQWDGLDIEFRASIDHQLRQREAVIEQRNQHRKIVIVPSTDSTAKERKRNQTESKWRPLSLEKETSTG